MLFLHLFLSLDARTTDSAGDTMPSLSPPSFLDENRIKPWPWAMASLLGDMAAAAAGACKNRLTTVISLLLLSIFLFLGCASSVAAKKVVTALPGFPGPLPLHLETGYVSVDEENGGELFYYFFPSESSPSTDPLLLWLTGGPRCSALSGAAFEIGPFRFVAREYDGTMPSLVYNEHTWTKMASIIFPDSPLGTGFSYSSSPKGYDVSDTSSSFQVHNFLLKWFRDHPQYLSNPFYVTGDSYAGKFIPFVTQIISEGIQQGKEPLINLKGYMVGNPITEEKLDFNYRVPYAHGVGIISDQIYESAVEHCAGEYISPQNKLCAEVMDVVDKLFLELDVGDITKPFCNIAFPKLQYKVGRRSLRGVIGLRKPPKPPPLYCISYLWYLSYYWANDNATREALGVKNGTVQEWIRCNRNLPYVGDIDSSIKYHRNLSSRGYRALVYSGDHDLVVPFLSTQAWVRSLNSAVVDNWRAWHVDGKTAGFTIAYSNNMTFATVQGGRHTAPENRPRQCFAMARRWLAHEPL